MDHRPLCAVLIPHKNQADMLDECLRALLRGLPPRTVALVVDDGSAPSQSLRHPHDDDPRVHLVRHPVSLGPAAARNTGIDWCRARGIEILVLLDSDCIPGDGFVEEHLALHKKYGDIPCIGGAIRGTGKSLWARIDRVASWFSSIPGSPMREVGAIYHIPTTNMSLNLNALSLDGALFNPRLRTGEDVEFIHRIRSRGGRALFSPTPVVVHRDRETLRTMLAHQYRWGVHTYVVRCGCGTRTGARAGAAMLFLPMFPLYVVVSSLLNLLPWVRVSARYGVYYPVLLALYAYKGIGVFHGILSPNAALYPPSRAEGMH